MAVTVDSVLVLQEAPRVVRVTVSSDEASPTYYWYREGVLEGQGVQPWRDFTLEEGESLMVEVFDSAGATPSTGYPRRLRLSWYAVGADAYRVEYWEDDSWATEVTLPAGGRDYFVWETGVLADGAEHQFRVVPVLAENDGLPRSMTVFMVGRPDAPTVTDSYDDGTGELSGTIT